jgi:hypothetical protein
MIRGVMRLKLRELQIKYGQSRAMVKDVERC